MKVNISETHDRLLQFGQQADFISKGCQDCINKRPKSFEDYPFYIFAHSRTIEADERISIFEQDMWMAHFDPQYVRKYLDISYVPTARLIWSPRLTKPIPQSNSMLFKSYPPGDNIKIIWMLPAKELWEQYEKGTMLEHQIVKESIHMFKTDFDKMGSREYDDLPDNKVDSIYSEVSKEKVKTYEKI